MVDTELEEGEARFDDNDDNIDPDIALSYIDKRLENLLGEFQKDFEGLISNESLGPRGGLYGTFLPIYKLPPTPHHHMKAPTFNKPCSNDSNRLLVASLNPVTPSSNVRPATAFDSRNVCGDQKALSANDSVSKDVLKIETATSKIANPNEKRSLKVRIKVGFENLAKKKDEVCSSLGLLSPSSSKSNNPEDSGGPPIESRDGPFDSPSSILRDMTSIFVPGNRLLSPLNENLLCLTELKTQKNGSFFVDDSISVSKREATQVAKKVVPFKKRETQKELVESKLFSPEITSKESDESNEQKNTKKFSLDVNGNGRVKAIMGPTVCKSESDVLKPETNHLRVKVPQRKSRLMAVQSSCKNETDVSMNKTDRFEDKAIEKSLFKRNSKLTGIQSSSISKENSRSSFSRALKDKKGVQKDILKVRNSYKDILDTSVEDQNIQAKPLDVSTGNATAKENHFDVNGLSADVAVPQQAEMGPADPSDNWVGCDRCEKWRLLPSGIEPDSLPDKWVCSMLTWLPGMNVCDISQDETTKAVQEMNLYSILQNQNSLSVNNVHSGHMNSNVNLEITPNNRLKTSKFRPEGSSSSLMENSHSSMEYRPKRKCSSAANEQSHEINLVNKPADVAMHAANGGDLQPKKLKRKTGSERDMSTLSDKNVEMHGKKRKLKDGSESQPYANTTLESGGDRIGGNEKRLKTCNTEVKDNKVRTMKIRLSTSKQNLVHNSHEKDKNTEKVTSSNKDLESEKLPFAATSSSSKVSGSCRRVSLQEDIKGGSPVGSVSSVPISRCFNREKTVSRKAEVGGIQRLGGLVDSTRKEASMIRNNVMSKNEIDVDACKITRKVNENGVMIPQGSGNGSLSSFKDKDDRSRCQRTNIMASDLLTDQEPIPNKIRKVETDSSGGKKISKKRTSDISIGLEKPTTSLTEHHPNSERKLSKKMCNSEITSTVNKDLRKDLNEVEAKAETCLSRSLKITSLNGSGQNGSKMMKRPGDAGNQNGKTFVTDPRNMNNDVGVISFLKEYASSQTALSAFNRAESSKDYAHRLKISGFDNESTDAYFDSALKLLYAASLLEENNTPDLLTKPGKVDPVNVYSSSVKLSQLCAQEYEKRNEIAATALAYKCIEVACMKMVYCKSSVTRQDLQTNMQMTTLGESPSSSASDVDNLNNQAMDKTILSKSIAHPVNLAVGRSQLSVTRILDLTSDASIAMEASMKSRKAYKELTVSVKKVVDFSFQNVKEFVSLVQNAREAINLQGFKGNINRQ